jgi:hypothetical protein
MNGLVVAVAWIAAALNVAAAIWGGFFWQRFRPSPLFWRLTRTGQAAIVVFAALSGVIALTGDTPDDDLFWIYVLVPLGVSFVAEQFRILSARTVLDQRGLADAQAMRRLSVGEQELIRELIIRRETGIMALAALANAFLLARAAMTAAGF